MTSPLRCSWAPSLAGVVTALAVTGYAPELAAYCPCYTASSPSNDHNCAIEAVAGSNPSDAQWLEIFARVSGGPESWGADGPSTGSIGQGCGLVETLHDVPAAFPCELLMAIAQAESGWRQFCVPDTPADQVGGAERTIISFDCGYGVGQVTSGMHDGETPSFDRQRVAADPTYNLATGATILAGKWRATECVGDNQPRTIEHWYTATWAYNGLAYSNNPNNPNYDPNRGVYNPNVGGSRPYQEKVFGWMENTLGHFAPTALAYPNPGDIGGGSSPPPLPEPNCASPTDCAGTRSTHVTRCDGTGGTGAGGSGGGAGASGGASPTGGAGTGATGGAGAGLGGQGATGTGAAGAGPEGGAVGLTGDNEGCACRTAPGVATRGLRFGALGALVAGGALVCVAGARRRGGRTKRSAMR